MKNDIVSRKQRRVEILMKWLQTNFKLSEVEQISIAKISWNLERQIQTIYQLYSALNEKIDFEEDTVLLKYEKELSKLIVDDNTIELENDRLKELLTVMIEVFEEILPIGSVVTINREMLPDMDDLDSMEGVRFIIVDRFLKKKDTEEYVPYCGVLYPFGSLADKRKIYFTPLAIDNVIFRGYEDSLDEAYICTMKDHIVEQNLYSIAFSLNEQSFGNGGEEYDKISNPSAN